MAGTDPRTQLAHDLDLLRRQAGLSYRELSKRSNCPVSTLNDALRGRRFPRLDTVVAVARACGVAPDDWRQRWVEANRAEPNPTADSTVVRQPPTDRPAQLPADIQTFTAREAELDQITAYAPGGGVVVLSGPAGVGKTALAVHAANLVASQYDDGQLFVDLHGFTPGMSPAAPADALARMLRGLEVRDTDMPSDLEERAALFRSRIAGRRMLVLLDNASSVGQVRPLLPGGTDALVLVTGRHHLAGLAVTHDARLLTLEPLDSGAAVRLLERVVGDRIGDEVDAVRTLGRLCGHLPLALRIAAAQLASQPRLTVRDLADRLAAGDRLARLELPGDEYGGVVAAFDRSYTALDTETRRLYRLLGLVPGLDFTAYVAAALLDSTTSYADALLQNLTTAHLVHQHSGGRYQLHDLLRDDARTRSAAEDTEPDRADAVRRVLQWYLHTAAGVSELRDPGRRTVPLDPASDRCPPLTFTDDGLALRWLDIESDNLFEAVRLAGDEHPDLCWKLTVMLWEYYYSRGRWDDWMNANTVALRATRRIRDQFAEATTLSSIGWAQHDRRQYEAAASAFEEAVRIRSEIGDRDGEASGLRGLGGAVFDLGRYDEGLTYCLRAAEIWRGLGDDDGYVAALLDIGENLRLLGRYDEALDYLRRALSVEQAATDRMRISLIFATIGQVRRGQGHHAEAVDWLERGLAEVGPNSERRRAAILVELGLAQVDNDQVYAGRASLLDASGILERFDDPQAEDVRKHLAAMPDEDTGDRTR